MTDYEELQKRCQRGATNLNDANNLLADCYGMLGKLGAENAELRNTAIELRKWASCEHFHHDKRDYHEYDEPCKALARIDAILSKEG